MMITNSVMQDMIGHAQEGLPNEVCGILVGRDFPGCRVCRMTNIEPSPVSYLIDPAEQFRILRELRQSGEKMLAIYHSHPVSAAFPSSKDVSLAFYPDALYIIISLAGKGPVVRAFSIEEGRIEERFFRQAPVEI